jgi:hypothetical protein
LTQIPLENDGRRGTKASHFERILFGNELMISETPSISILSKFSLSLLKDSNFYHVDVNQAEDFFWGKNAGCNFVSFFCDGISEILFGLLIVNSPGRTEEDLFKVIFEELQSSRTRSQLFTDQVKLFPKSVFGNEKANLQIQGQIDLRLSELEESNSLVLYYLVDIIF